MFRFRRFPAVQLLFKKICQIFPFSHTTPAAAVLAWHLTSESETRLETHFRPARNPLATTCLCVQRNLIFSNAMQITIIILFWNWARIIVPVHKFLNRVAHSIRLYRCLIFIAYLFYSFLTVLIFRHDDDAMITIIIYSSCACNLVVFNHRCYVNPVYVFC